MHTLGQPRFHPSPTTLPPFALTPPSAVVPDTGFRKWLSTRVQLIQDGCKDDSEFATPLLRDDEAAVLLRLPGVTEAEPHR